MGHSLGGALSSLIAADHSSSLIYDGICFIAPYFDVYNPRMFEKLVPLVRMAVKVTPDKKINIRDKPPKRHLKQWSDDPVN